MTSLGYVERRKLKSGETAYRAQKRVDGSKVSKQFSSEEDARAWLAGEVVTRTLPITRKPSPSSVTVETFYADHLDLINVDLRKSTTRWYDLIVRKHVLPFWGGVRLCDIEPFGVEVWINRELPQGGKSQSTVRACYIAFKKIIAVAVRSGALKTDPLAGVKPPKMPANKKHLGIGQADVAKLSETIDPRYKAFVLIMAYGGLRYGEAAALTRASFEPGFRSLLVEGALDRDLGIVEPKTASGRRRVPLPSVIREAMEEHARTYAGNHLLFVTKNGAPLAHNHFRENIWAPAVQSCGLKITPHQLRHFAITMWIANGATVLEVKSWAGHASAAFTLDRYGHLFSTSGDAVMASIEAASSDGPGDLGAPVEASVSVAPSPDITPETDFWSL